jgi:hypothetical protein
MMLAVVATSALTPETTQAQSALLVSFSGGLSRENFTING